MARSNAAATGDPDADAVLSSLPTAAVASSESGDPDADAVLASLSRPQKAAPTAAPANRIEPMTEPGEDVLGMGRSLVGAGEAAAHYATAGGAGLLGLATMGAAEHYPDVWQRVANAITYSPRSDAGKEFVRIGDAALSIPHRAGQAVGEYTGIPEVGKAVESAFTMAPLLKGVNPAFLASAPLRAPGAFMRGTVPAALEEQAAPLSVEQAPPRAYGSLYTPPVRPAEAPANLSVEATPPRATPTPWYQQPNPMGRPGPEPIQATVEPAAARPAPYEPADLKVNVAEEVPAVKAGELPAAAQADRVQTLRDIGFQPGQIRQSAVTGSIPEGGNDFQIAQQRGTPHGDALRNVFSAEREHLERYADDIIDRTGGTAGMDEATALNRGETILRPFEGLQDWFTEQTKKLYNSATERLGGTPVNTPKIGDIVADNSNFANTEEIALQSALKARMQRLGMMDADGKMLATNVKTAEQLRQYLNEKWQPKTSKLIGQMKDALDDDVTEAAGEDVYKAARAMRELRGRTLDDPNGISKLIDSSGPKGINRRVDAPKVGDYLTSMTPRQFEHIVGVLKDLPEELRPTGDAALAEIRAQFANQIKAQGSRNGAVGASWNANAVRKYLAQNSSKLPMVFDPDELRRIQTLNKGGQILNVDRSYPGAYNQQVSLEQVAGKAAQTGIRAAGAAAASHVPFAGPAASWAADRLGQTLSASASRRLVQERLWNGAAPPPP